MKTALLSFLFLFFPLSALAVDAATQQHIEQLQAQIRALEEQAQQYREGIAEQQDKAQTLNREIAILQGQINQIQARISATGAKINLTETKILTTAEQIDQLQASMTKKRGTVGRILLFLDQGGQQHLVASLLKYQNLATMLQQVHDAGNVQEQLLGVIDDLQAEEDQLESTRTELEAQQAELQELQDAATRQKDQLNSVRSVRSKVLKDTKGQEALYQKQLLETEKKEAAFFNELKKIESQVIAGGLYIVHVVATNVPTRAKLFSLPEAHPRLTQSYGMTQYARRGAYGGAGHNGVDYASGHGEPVLAIGDGIVIARGTNDGWGNWIAIQHPNQHNLVSLYGHMSAFGMIIVGGNVARGQVIGYEGKTGHATGSHVHLSIYREFFTYLNEKNGQLQFNYFEGSLNPANYF